MSISAPPEAMKMLCNQDGSALERLGGFEAELGIQAKTVNANKNIAERVEQLIAYTSIQMDDWTILDCMDEEGDRRYVDVGNPEISTAEDISFIGSAMRVDKGLMKMAEKHQAAEQDVSDYIAEKGLGLIQLELYASGGAGQNESRGFHLNSLSKCNLSLDDFVRPLAAHHTSRIVWSGAGDVVTNRDNSWQFVLSERANHIWELVGSATMRSRALVNTKNEALADVNRYRRIHDISAELVFAPKILALLRASESIMLRACEIEEPFTDDLMPNNPVMAIRKISYDPSLKAKIEMEDGSKLTGIEHQQKLAAWALKAICKREYITEQERKWGKWWLELLDDLSTDPEKRRETLSWLLKFQAVDRALQKPIKAGESYLSVAKKTGLLFHRLLPNYGLGMKLLLNEVYEGSPESDFFTQPLELPNTRAKPRTEAVRRLRAQKIPFTCKWDVLKLEYSDKNIKMMDPYATEDYRLEALLQSVDA